MNINWNIHWYFYFIPIMISSIGTMEIIWSVSLPDVVFFLLLAAAGRYIKRRRKVYNISLRLSVFALK
jgi:hypothetical protein